MALERFKQALASLLDGAPSDPLERDEYFELHTLPTAGGQDFEVVICDEEKEIFAVIYTAHLFEEGDGVLLLVSLPQLAVQLLEVQS